VFPLVKKKRPYQLHSGESIISPKKKLDVHLPFLAKLSHAWF